MGSLVIAEPSAGGHRLWYVRLLVDEAIRAGRGHDVVIITTPETAASAEWSTHVGPVERDLTVTIDTTAMPKWRASVLEGLAVGAADRLVLPDGDKWLIDLVRGPRLAAGVSVLLMRPALPHGYVARARAIGKRLVLRRAQRIEGITLFRLAMFPGPRTEPALPEVPDPIQISDVAGTVATELKRRHQIGAGDRVALIIGDLSERKSVAEVSAAWPAVRDQAARLVLVGSLDAGVREAVTALAATDPRVVVDEAYIDDDAFDGWIAAADVVLALHRNVGSSGVALKAWALGVPVAVYAGSDLECDLRGAGAAVVPVGSSSRQIADDLAEFFADGVQVSSETSAEAAVRTKLFTTALLGTESHLQSSS